MAHISVGLAVSAALVLFSLLAFTQAYWLVVVAPVVALAFVTVGALLLLGCDAAARKKNAR